jgi:transposase
MNKERGGIARQFVLGVVQSAEGLPLMHTVHAGNVAETRTLQSMLQQVLQRFAIERVIVVADRGLLSLENIGALEAVAETSGRQLQFILAVPARRYAELGGTLEAMTFDEGIAEGRFAEQRLVVAHDAERAATKADQRRQRINELTTFADQLVSKLDLQDGGQTERGRRATDRGAYSRFQRAITEAELSRFVKADYQADRFSYQVDEVAIKRAEQFDGKLVLLTNVNDMDPEQIVARYKSLADIERGFRVLKSDLDIAPVYHRLPDRIRAHAMICFMALVLYRVMRMRLKAKGSTTSPTTALSILRRIQQHQTTIGECRYRGISKTTPTQLDIFDTLELPRPKRV